MLFQPCAEDLAARLQVAKNGSVLELACGTGAFLTRFTDWSTFDSETTATDLNEPMFRHAAAGFVRRGVQWMQADACNTLLATGCSMRSYASSGIMFVPDKALARAKLTAF
jgi:ubiquinone/menaquinone biosynthesis C-methylase UbiE